MKTRPLLAVLAVLASVLLSACAANKTEIQADATPTDTTADVGAARQDPTAAALLSAFFGLDNDLPQVSNARICRDAGGADGMPVIFSREVDPATLQAGDFRVTSAAGVVGTVTCVTLAPAVDPGELRTALLVGELGSAADDPPATVEVIGNLLSSDRSLNFKGATVAVTPLAPGPTLVLAELVPEGQWKTGAEGGPWGSGSGCPTGTVQAVRAVWAGGVTLPDDGEPGEVERALYRVTIAGAEVSPFALADLDDGDNNHLLCLDVTGKPEAVAFPGGHLVDPNDDLNPDTSVGINQGM